MITLHTGLPGHGKTLFEIVAVRAMAEKASPPRPVYYSGIRELTLPWVNIGGYIKNEDTGAFEEIIPADAPVKGGCEWYKLPTGSIVIIDECHNYFQPRGQGQPVPQTVVEFATHRHRGFDIILLSQHPALIDVAVRRLVERHYHSMRWFGMPVATVHEFMGVKDQIEKSRKGSIEHKFAFPKSAYKLYKSAEVHTVKSRIPARLWFFVVAPVLLAVLGYYLVKLMMPYAAGEGAKQRIQGKGAVVSAPAGGAAAVSGSSSGGRDNKVMTAPEYIAAFSPRIQGLPHSAPIFDKVMEPVVAPTPVACVASAARCSCYTEQGTQLDVDEATCGQIVKRGFFQYWARAANQPQQGVVPLKASLEGQHQPLSSVAAPAVPSPVQALPEPPKFIAVRPPVNPSLRAPNVP